MPVGETLWPPDGLWPALNLRCNPHRLAAQTTGRLGNDLVEVEEVGSSSSRGGGLGAEEGGSCKVAYLYAGKGDKALSLFARLEPHRMGDASTSLLLLLALW